MWTFDGLVHHRFGCRYSAALLLLLHARGALATFPTCQKWAVGCLLALLIIAAPTQPTGYDVGLDWLVCHRVMCRHGAVSLLAEQLLCAQAAALNGLQLCCSTACRDG